MFILRSFHNYALYMVISVSILCNDKLLNEIGLATLITKHIYRFLCFHIIMNCLSNPDDKYLFKVP